VQLVRNGLVEITGGVSSMGATDVTFEDGSSRQFDAIVAATGFRPGVNRFLQSSETFTNAAGERPAVGENGLYFCGFSVTPTGMFREIGIEARRIAEHMARAP
jgi:hypothetical protein